MVDVVYSTPMTRNGSGLSGPVLPKCPPPQGSIIPKPAEPVHTNAVIMPWYALRVIDPTTKDWSTWHAKPSAQPTGRRHVNLSRC